VDTKAFIAWALDDARTIEERYTTKLLVELGVGRWNSKRKIYEGKSLDESVAQSRERKLNPAYQPHYSAADLAKAVEYLAEIKQWWAHSDRPIRSLEPLRFLTTLETLQLAFGEPSDVSPLAELPALRKLELGYPGSEHNSSACVDYTPLARCTALRELTLAFGTHWPDLTGIETLQELETFHLSGNLLAMPRDTSFPNVRRGSLYCRPLAARSVADLPQFPACEFLTVSGVEKLDGIEKIPHLRNLTILGPFASFAPLESLHQLTCLTVGVPKHGDQEHQPRDVAPLTRLPQLLSFRIGPDHYGTDMPRDYAPLAEAPALRELVVQRCPPVEMEVAAINAGLLPWDDVFLAAEPRPIPPLRMIIAPHQQNPYRKEPHRSPREPDLIDTGLRKVEERWVKDYIARTISKKIGNEDWGTVDANGERRGFNLTIESFEVVERLPEIVEAARTALAHLRDEYIGRFAIHLRVRPPKPSAAQEELDKELQQRRDQWEHDQQQHDEAEYLDRLHQLELKKQQGMEIDPAEFSPAEQPPYPQMEDLLPPPQPDEIDFTSGNDAGDEGNGDIAVDTDPDPPKAMFEEDDAHPLASNYLCAGSINLAEVWFCAHFRGLACHLMQREPDFEIPEEKKEA
jgi:hypothetical protein